MAEIKKIQIRPSDGTLIPDRNEKSIFSAWNISFFGAIALLSALFFFYPDPYKEIMLFIPDGILITFIVTISAISISLIIGLLTGLGRISRNPVVNRIATIYVEIIRGIPLLVQLIYLYFALNSLLHLPRLLAAILAMSVCYGAYLGEIFRGGILSIPKGQMEAALALGLSRGQAISRIIIPQTLRVILPPVGNEFIALLKDSSLVSILAISDLLRRGREYAARTFEYFEAYTVVALIYLIITLFLSKMVFIMETKLERHGE